MSRVLLFFVYKTKGRKSAAYAASELAAAFKVGWLQFRDKLRHCSLLSAVQINGRRRPLRNSATQNASGRTLDFIYALFVPGMHNIYTHTTQKADTVNKFCISSGTIPRHKHMTEVTTK
jgi:hypothetical protein